MRVALFRRGHKCAIAKAKGALLSVRRTRPISREKGDIMKWTMPERHPLSAAFGNLPDAEYQQMKARIDEGAIERTETVDGVPRTVRYPAGIVGPAYMYEDMLLDGYHRVRACHELGLEEMATVEFKGDDPLGFVIAKNLMRRHQTAVQRAIAVGRCLNAMAQGRPNNSAKSAGFQTADDVAALLGCSTRTVELARQIENEGYGDRVLNGEMAASGARHHQRAAPSRRRLGRGRGVGPAP